MAAHAAVVSSGIYEAVHRNLIASRTNGRFFNGAVGVGHHVGAAGGAGGLAGGGGNALLPNSTQLDSFLFHPDTRTQCFKAALTIAGESPKLKPEVANMLLLHLSGFVPSEAVLEEIREFANQNANEGSEYRELHRLAEIQIQEVQRYNSSKATSQQLSLLGAGGGGQSAGTAAQLSESDFGASSELSLSQSGLGAGGGSGATSIPSGTVGSGGGVTLVGGPSGGSLYHYTTLSALRGPLVEHSRRMVAMGMPPASEVHIVANEKNSRVLRAVANQQSGGAASTAPITPGVPESVPLNFNIVHCKDVIAQTPIAASPELISEQITILRSYNDQYSKSPQVAIATRMFIKLLFDSYKRRMRLTPYDKHFRVATCSFLTPLLTLVGSEWQNIKLQTYEVLTNIAVQAQLFDRSCVDGVPTASVEAECWWMLAQVLQRELLIVKKDRRESDTIWFAAMKCTLFILPPQFLSVYVDPRVLHIFLNLPSVAEMQPGIYAVLLDALATRVCGGFSSNMLRWRAKRAAKSSAHHSRSGSAVSDKGAGSSSHRHNRSGSGVPAASGGLSSSHPMGGTTAQTSDNNYPAAAVSNLPVAPKPSILELDDEAYALVGGDVTFTQLYTKATTSAARDAAFLALYCSAAQQVGRRPFFGPRGLAKQQQQLATGGNASSSSSSAENEKLWSSVQMTVNAVMKIGLPWQFHTYLLYQSPNTAKELTQQLTLDIGLDRDEKAFMFSTLAKLLEITYTHTQAVPPGLEKLNLADAATLLPGLMKDGDTVVQTAAVSAAVVAIRDELTKKLSDADLRKGVSRDCMPLFQALLPTTVAQRNCGIQLLERMAAMARTLPSAVHAFTQFFNLLLNNSKVVGGEPLGSAHLLPMYRALVSLLTRQHGGRGDGDMSEQCLAGVLQVVQASADQVGSQLLWSVYFALRPLAQGGAGGGGGIAAGGVGLGSFGPQVASPASRARQVLVSILAPMDLKDAASDLYIWSRVMDDPNPAVAVIGAQQVIKNCGLAHYDRYDAAIKKAEQGQSPSDVLKSAFHMASTIVGKQ